MTPDQARRLLDGTTPGPWGHYLPRGKDGHYDPVFGDVPGDEIALVKRPADWHLIAAAPVLAAMVAGMREEWGVSLPDGQLVGAGWGTYDTALEDMNAWRRDGYDARIVRRYVTEPEEA